MRNNLPPFYLITPEFNGNLNEYLTSLENSLKHGIKLVQLRSKQLPTSEYFALAQEVSKLVRQYHAKLLLNNSPDLLQDIDADGIHFPSNQLMRLTKNPLNQNYLMSASCHDAIQIAHALSIKPDITLISPICPTPCNEEKPNLGWDKFAQMIQNVPLKIYALGGLKAEDYNHAYKLGAHGIAATRAFWNIKNS